MTHFTVLLVVVLSGPLDGAITGLIFPSMDECIAAHKIISDMLNYDHSIECKETEEISE